MAKNNVTNAERLAIIETEIKSIKNDIQELKGIVQTQYKEFVSRAEFGSFEQDYRNRNNNISSLGIALIASVTSAIMSLLIFFMNKIF